MGERHDPEQLNAEGLGDMLSRQVNLIMTFQKREKN